MSPKKRSKVVKKVAKKPETITLSKGAVSHVSVAKGLRISYNKITDAPVVEFQGGPWTGKDVSQVIGAIPRAYRFYKLTQRREGVTK